MPRSLGDVVDARLGCVVGRGEFHAHRLAVGVRQGDHERRDGRAAGRRRSPCRRDDRDERRHARVRDGVLFSRNQGEVGVDYSGAVVWPLASVALTGFESLTKKVNGSEMFGSR